MSANWSPVFHGSIVEVLVLQETLEANGIPTLAPGIDHPDLLALSGSGYAIGLLVPEGRLELARSLVPESKRPGSHAGAGELPVAAAEPVEAHIVPSRAVALPPSSGGPPEELGGEA